MIFHSYVSLPEGNYIHSDYYHTTDTLTYTEWMFVDVEMAALSLSL